MREILVCTFLTLGGVMQVPGGSDGDAERGSVSTMKGGTIVGVDPFLTASAEAPVLSG